MLGKDEVCICILSVTLFFNPPGDWSMYTSSTLVIKLLVAIKKSLLPLLNELVLKSDEPVTLGCIEFLLAVFSWVPKSALNANWLGAKLTSWP